MTPTELDSLDLLDREGFTRFNMAGYRIISGTIFKTVQDFEEGEHVWEGVEVGSSSGSYAQDYEDLAAANWPRHADEIQCRECMDSDVPSLGDLCSACNWINIEQARAGE